MLMLHKFAVFLMISTLFVLGCTSIQPAQNYPTKNETSINETKNAELQADCLGLTAEKVQQVCGSGPLKRVIEKTSNEYQIKEGYKCTYYVLDTAIPGCENSSSDDTICPVELTLTYDTGRNISDVAEALKNNKNLRMRETCNGFYSLMPEDIGFERQLVLSDFYRQNGSLLTTLYSSDLDYEATGENPAQACSFCEIWQLQSYLYNETTEEPPDGCREREAIEDTIIIENLSEPAGNESAANESPCYGLIYEIKINESGSSNESERGADISDGNTTRWRPAEKGQRLTVGSEIQTGLDTEIIVTFQCGDPIDRILGAALVRADTNFRIIEIGPDDKVQVFIDPAVAIPTVKQLPQFQTDFRVSPSRAPSCPTD